MSEYIRNRHPEERDGFFCRFTFGQFFAILVLEVFTIFFVFYLGARYGREFLGLEPGSIPIVAETGPAGEVTAEGEAAKVLTTADPETAKMAGELIAKAGTPELKERIKEMIGRAQQRPDAAAVPNVMEIESEPVVPEQTQVFEREAASSPQTPIPVVEKADEREGWQDVVDDEVGKKEPPDTTQGSAEKAEEKMAATKESGFIRVKSAESARYSVQVGSYPQLGEANRSVEKWKSKGYPAYMMIADIPERGRWYRVRIGGFESRKDAASYLKEIQSREEVEALIVLNEQ